MKLASQASALECRGELGVCVMVFVVKAHDARLAQLIHNFLKYLMEKLLEVVEEAFSQFEV
jgi:hypothetical protein